MIVIAIFPNWLHFLIHGSLLHCTGFFVTLFLSCICLPHANLRVLQVPRSYIAAKYYVKYYIAIVHFKVKKKVAPCFSAIPDKWYIYTKWTTKSVKCCGSNNIHGSFSKLKQNYLFTFCCQRNNQCQINYQKKFSFFSEMNYNKLFMHAKFHRNRINGRRISRF